MVQDDYALRLSVWFKLVESPRSSAPMSSLYPAAERWRSHATSAAREVEAGRLRSLGRLSTVGSASSRYAARWLAFFVNLQQLLLCGAHARRIELAHASECT